MAPKKKGGDPYRFNRILLIEKYNEDKEWQKYLREHAIAIGDTSFFTIRG